MKCGICNRKRNNLTTCEECGVKFCPECGDEKREWCKLCIKFEEAQKNNVSNDT